MYAREHKCCNKCFKPLRPWTCHFPFHGCVWSLQTAELESQAFIVSVNEATCDRCLWCIDGRLNGNSSAATPRSVNPQKTARPTNTASKKRRQRRRYEAGGGLGRERQGCEWKGKQCTKGWGRKEEIFRRGSRGKEVFVMCARECELASTRSKRAREGYDSVWERERRRKREKRNIKTSVTSKQQKEGTTEEKKKYIKDEENFGNSPYNVCVCVCVCVCETPSQ